MLADLDGRAVARGALLTLAVMLPPVWVVRALKGDDTPTQESYLWVVPVVAIFVAFPLGGWVAGRRQRSSPLLHGASAALAAYALVILAALIRLAVSGDLSLGTVITMALLLQIAVSLGLLGGWAAARETKDLT